MRPRLSFPPTSLQLTVNGDKHQIRCLIRKKWLVLTPEEWVRQHVIGYLIQSKKIAPSRIAVEKGIIYNSRQKRWDIVTYDDYGKPEILIECKGHEIPLSQETLVQIGSYQQQVNAKKLVVTNGLDCFTFDLVQWRSGIESI